MRKLKPLKANIAVTTSVFLATFIVFCAFGLDTAFVVLDRFKLQKATETVALASAAYLNSGAVDPNLPSEVLQIHGLPAASIKTFETKYEDGSHKVRITTEMPAETYFLRFVGVGYVVLKATSAAKTFTQIPENQKFGEAIELNPLLTDKRGEDFSVESPYGYYVFAGIDSDAGIMWEDVGCKANVTTTDRTVGLKEFKAICENASFDLSQPCDYKPYSDSIGVVKYIRVYKDPDACLVQPGASKLEVKVLNNVRLINPKDF